MPAGELAHILRKIRLRDPKTVRSAISVLGEAFADSFGTKSCVIELPSEKTVYMSRALSGISKDELTRVIGLDARKLYKWTVLDPARESEEDHDSSDRLSICKIPLLDGTDRFGFFSLVSMGPDTLEADSMTFLSEVISSVLVQFIPKIERRNQEDRKESLKIELLEAARDEMMMRGVLLRMMEISGAEFCAYYCQADDRVFHAMLDSRELVSRVPDIREKLSNTFDMFTNNQPDLDICKEKIYYRSQERNLTYLVGSTRVESYFLVPVTFDSVVRGVLFFGSVREDAFVRENISYFRSMADEEGDRTPVMYMLSGELAVLKETVRQIPEGCALVSRDGSIVYSNQMFSRTLGMEEPVPERFDDLDRISSFNFTGLWNEFSLLGVPVTGRELMNKNGNGACISVDWAELEKVSREVGSVLLVRDISRQKDKEREGEELMATVAHELRTPMTALKNSMKILVDNNGNDSGGWNENRFAATALRTIDRLDLLVNGLVDSSSLRRADRELNPKDTAISQLLEDASLLFLNSMKKKEIEFRTEIEPELSVIHIDRDMIEQVIQNLISNSMKHVPSGGSITVSVKTVDPENTDYPHSLLDSVIADPRFVEILVSDTGSGLPDDVKYDINIRAQQETGRLRKSKGLGLLIAGRLIRMHGGKMSAEESEDCGAVIRLCLPADRETSQAVRTWSRVLETVSGLLEKGSSPTLISFSRDETSCWLEYLSGWTREPVVEPDTESIGVSGSYFWPVSGTFAMAIDLDEDSDMLLVGTREKGMKIGKATFPEGGRTATELLTNSIETMALQPVSVV